jgi:membrane protein DedA with SNARE-associated domain
MDSKKGINWFFAFIAFTLGLTLSKHIDFKNLTLKEPILDILYLIVFVISIYLILKNYKKRHEK